MILTFEHTCLPKTDGQVGCPIAGREVPVNAQVALSGVDYGRLNEYAVPDVRCIHTNGKLKLVAIDGNRDI